METSNRDLVEIFYAKLWDRWDKSVAREILSDDFLFRGSLGADRKGIDGFLDYVDQVRSALGDYRSDIGEMVEDADRIAVRMTFSGKHQGEFFGVPASGRRISWCGAAFFTFRDGRISALWVLGDVDGVKAQLGIAQGQFERPCGPDGT
ncbi:MAG: ester cyclase [Kiloniellales bacterium]|nr:ester cyclase [Kiloniellales bacterium]